MKKSLMLIESPNKIKTIQKYVSDFNIDLFATVGHIRELDEKYFNRLGYDEETYETRWKNDAKKTIKGKTIDVIAEINRLAAKADNIYLATDPDREGEAISWHIYSVLNPIYQSKCKRITFNEITKDAIFSAIDNPRSIDLYQVNSYLARKILDRGLGFKLSGFSRNVVGGVSAGRVQSIALKFLKDKYEEIQSFVPAHWFNIIVFLKCGIELILKSVDFNEKLNLYTGVSNGMINFKEESQAKDFLSNLSDFYKLIDVSEPKIENQRPPKPFKTSTMHSKAITKFNMSASTVDRLSQRLYEGVEIDGESISLITYPRTDREDLSKVFIESAKSFVENEFGHKYWNGAKVGIEKKALVQGAHEAIRPVYIDITPDSIKGKIDDNEYKLYSLIWTYAVSSLMSRAIYENVTYSFENKGNIFSANQRIEIFGGFKDLFRKYANSDSFQEDLTFKDLVVGGSYKVDNDKTKVKKTDKSPPSPYTESTLIKSLEAEGIGRPSTYSHIVDIVVKRNYSEKIGGKLMITELGLKMSKILEKNFPTIMKYDYTRNMEQELDNISEDKVNWKIFLKKVFELFDEELSNANKQAFGQCEICGSDLISRYSIKTKSNFISCSAYPNCKFIKKTPAAAAKSTSEPINEPCPECNSALVKRKSKNGTFFIGCSAYPNCKFIRNETPIQTPTPVESTSSQSISHLQQNSSNLTQSTSETNKFCPHCNSVLVKKRTRKNTFFLGCSNYPNCKYIENSYSEAELLDEECPKCSFRLSKRMGRWNKYYIRCSNKECDYRRPLSFSMDK